MRTGLSYAEDVMMLELNAQSIGFLVFSVFTIGGGLGVVTSRNLIHGALYLILSLFGAAGLFVLLSAEFLAAVQVLVYIGAIAILIIFAVMLTRSMTRLSEVFNRQWWLSALVAIGLFVLILVGVILPVFGSMDTASVAPNVATTVDLGVALVDGNQYVLPFEVASILLTAA
ncbi:MAG: NADH-quinone oxidoreductase subunit J, partial [Anaerolineae bacterium]|nr:NADH-quinone oxidoreductase subunit J [Anaerolineae bacterium]